MPHHLLIMFVSLILHLTVKCLDARNGLLVDGAMKCLDMFASGENLSDQHLPQLLPILFPHLLRVFSSVRAS